MSVSRHVGRHFEITAEGVRFLDLTRAASRPSLWLELFRIALSNGCAVSEQALTCIEQNIERYAPDDFMATDGDRQLVRSMLYPRPGLYARLTEMHDCGLLDRVFPEFARIHGRVVRDFYHKYTVDEHTLLAIRGVESLWNPANPSQQRFNSILQELHTPELLTLALLFHDVGKWRETEHVQESVQLAQSMLDRLELPTDARRTVEFLIRNHLLMSQVAFRRDFDDPHVVKQFADLIGSEERLKLLCLMTLADVGAVNPDVLTPWKEDLLWRLYVHAYNRLTLGYADELLQKDPAGPVGRRRRASRRHHRGRAHGLSQGPAAPLPDALRPRVHLPARAPGARHPQGRGARVPRAPRRRLGADARHARQAVSSSRTSPACLSYFGMDIHRGQAMTTPEGLVLDVFQFADEGGFLRLNADAPAEISRMLESVVAGSHRRADAAARQAAEPALSQPAPRRAGRPLRQRALAQVHRAGARRRRCAGAAVSHQPRDLGLRLRRRSRVDLDRRQEGG